MKITEYSENEVENILEGVKNGGYKEDWCKDKAGNILSDDKLKIIIKSGIHIEIYEHLKFIVKDANCYEIANIV